MSEPITMSDRSVLLKQIDETMGVALAASGRGDHLGFLSNLARASDLVKLLNVLDPPSPTTRTDE